MWQQVLPLAMLPVSGQMTKALMTNLFKQCSGWSQME
jgi:hypothetical protein